MKAEDSRERSVEQLLRRSLRDSGAPGSDSCLDAETLAAWIDGGLDDGALMMAEAHASGCERCQALLGAVARSAPDAPMAAPWWRREWRVRWLVPLAASAAAIALWMVVPAERFVSPPQQQAESQARAETPAAPTLSDQSQVQGPEAARQRREAPAAGRADGLAAESRNAAGTPRADVSAIPKRESPAAAKSVDERALAKSPAAPPPAATSRSAEPASELLGRLSAAETREIVSPGSATRWRLGAAGSVEYSTDGGATWEPLTTGVSAELTAGSSPSASVCWLVGRGGIVLLTTDGRRWQRVPFPEPADLVSVQAADARRATVTTSDGRTFRTEDAGQTWVRVSPQDW